MSIVSTNWLADVAKFLVGVVVGAIATILVEEMLGPKLRVTFASWRKRLGRIVRDDPVTGVLQMRLDLVSPKPEEEITDVVEEVFRSSSITEVSYQADMIRALAKQGHTDIQIRVVPMHRPLEDEDAGEIEQVESLSAEMTCQLSYKRFYDTLADLTAMAGKLINAFAPKHILMDADSTEFEHPVQGYSERPLRELPIIRSSNRDHRRSVATSRYFGDDSPPLEVETLCSRILTVRLGSVGPPGLR